MLLFIVGFREFTIPMILQSPDNAVLSVMMWKAFQSGKTMEAAALGTIIVLLVIPVDLSWCAGWCWRATTTLEADDAAGRGPRKVLRHRATAPSRRCAA